MALPILPVSPIGGSLPIQQVGRTAPAGGVSEGSSFGDILGEQLDKLSAAQAKADSLSLQAATGDLKSIQDFTIASTEAQLLTQLTVQVRNRAVEAFNDIMRMQV